MAQFEPVLTRYVKEPGSYTLDIYVADGGYQALRKAAAMPPEAIIDEVKKSGLRGRGGAGFPTGMKWGFVPKDNPKPKYLLINADESEPGTFKDHVLLERNPHLLIEGCVIGCRAIGAKVCYIYIRGEFYHLQPQLEAAIAEARAAGYLGQNILGSGQDCEIYVHRGAGAYKCGEETALIESLEGKRAQPRIKPPFPAVVGLFGCPTIVNNVETLCNVPPIIEKGAEWFAAIGPEKNQGPKLFCVCGHVKKPGRLRGPHGRDDARADLRLRRRHPRGPEDQGDDPRRLVGQRDPAATSSTRRPASTRSSPPARCSARPPSSSWTRPPTWSGRRRT